MKLSATLAAVLSLAVTQAGVRDTSIAWPGGPPAGAILSPDARLASFVDAATHELHVRNLATGESRQLTRIASDKGEVGSGVISWDNAQIAFFSRIPGQGAGIRILPVNDSTDQVARLLMRNPDIDPIEFSRDGKKLLVLQDTPQGWDIGLINVADGLRRSLKVLNSPSPLRLVALSPDGAYVAYDRSTSPVERHHAISLIPVDGGPDIEILNTPHWNSVVGWLPDSTGLVIVSDRSGRPGLWKVRVANGNRAGEPELITSEIDGVPLGVTAQGNVLFRKALGASPSHLYAGAIDAQGRPSAAAVEVRTSDPAAFNRYPRWSADGSSFMYVSDGLLGPSVVVQPQGGRAATIPLTLGAFSSFEWSPDRTSIVCKCTDLDRRVGIYVIDVATGRPRRLSPFAPAAVMSYYHPQFSRDGHSVTMFKSQGAGATVTWSYVEWSLASGVEHTIHADLADLMGKPNGYPAGRSPDGRYLLSLSDQNSTVHVFDSATSKTRELLRTEKRQGFHHYGDLRWLPDSRAIITTIGSGGGTEQELWWIPIEGQAHKIDVGVRNIAEHSLAIHPNGRQIAFVAGALLHATMPLSASPSRSFEFRILEWTNGQR